MFPRIAESFAIRFGGSALRDLAKEVFLAAKNKNNFDRLNEAHSLASGVKAVFTIDAVNGIETLRRSLGGHGFSYYSGIPGLLNETSPTPTYEGKNNIIQAKIQSFTFKLQGFCSNVLNILRKAKNSLLLWPISRKFIAKTISMSPSLKQ